VTRRDGPSRRTVADDVCRTPWKIRYDSRKQAKQQIREATGMSALRGQLRPYSCSCGGWHLTHLTKRAAKQIARHRNMAA
jgi:hypothetical protein